VLTTFRLEEGKRFTATVFLDKNIVVVQLLGIGSQLTKCKYRIKLKSQSQFQFSNTSKLRVNKDDFGIV
jgi:hypothetical protein